MSEKDIAITVVMAVYNPPIDWFKELLESLAMQDFSDVEWLIIDDASDKISISELTDLIKDCTAFQEKKIPFKIWRNNKNIGSDQTYRKLMVFAEGEYIAFCDQDDIWEENKLSRLYEEIVKHKGVLAYADMSVIDSKGIQIKESYHDKRKIFGHISGEKRTAELLTRNCAPGCNILVKKEVIRQYKNIPQGTYWDHWLNIIASTQGKIIYIPEKLMRYRIHGTNQTGRFNNIFNKNDYYRYRLKPLYDRMIEMKKREIHFLNEEKVYSFIKARYNKNLYDMWKYRSCGKVDAYFEIFLMLLPKCIIKEVFKWIKK